MLRMIYHPGLHLSGGNIGKQRRDVRLALFPRMDEARHFPLL